MDMNILVCMLIAIVAALISIVVTYFITKKVVIERGTIVEIAEIKVKMIDEYRRSKDFQDLLNNQFNLGKATGTDESLLKYKESHEFKSLLEHEYLKGREIGKQEALLTYKDSLEFDAILKNEFHKGRKEGIEGALKEYKESPEFLAIKANEFSSGEKKGEQTTMSKFKIKYDIWQDYDDGFFTTHYIDGYNMQLFFNNLPIGDPTKRVLKKESRFKKENLEFLLNELHRAVGVYIQLSNGFGIPAVLMSNTPDKIDSGIKI